MQMPEIDMAWLKRTRAGWERTKLHAHNARTLPVNRALSGFANGDQMVYALNPAYLEIGQGGVSPMRGWGAIAFGMILHLLVLGIDSTVRSISDRWDRYGFDGPDGIGFGVLLEILFVMCITALGLLVCGVYFAVNFFSVTDATIRLDNKRKKVWLWTSKGPIEIDWHKLTPRVESSVATAYATVKTYRGQYAELGPDGSPLTTNGIPHVFQCGQIAAAEEGVLPSMEYVRRYMDIGPDAVEPPAKFLSHKVRWYALVNLFGMADDWVRWKENRERPGVAPAPWIRTVIFIVLFPVFFPMQFTNWLALAIAPKPKWPRELESMHQADLITYRTERTPRLPRKPVIRVNGALLSDEGGSSKP